ncbi:unnamed protein product, partial [Rotaria sp. Silwood1]
ITYLLSLCEYGDLHLRGACANLLVTLIQTTNHLLTLSSLSNSFNNSFINQCSLVSTDSQVNSSHAFTIIEIELLEDSIQHTTSAYVLAKFALVQFIDDIDFRILTYLEQQQLKQQYPDIRVRQATASTFAKSESDFQATVLNLLVQLLLMRHFIFCIAEFLVMLSHDTLHSKRVINIQDLIKHYDSLLASGHEPETHVIVNSVQIEDDKWKRLSRQIDQSLLDIYPTQLTLFDVVSSVALRSIDPFVVAFRALNDVLLSVNGTRDETFKACWSPILTPSSLITHLSISSQLQSYCELICHHELYVEHFTSITTHYQLLLLFFIEQSDTCTYVHNLFDLIHHTSVASHLFVCEGIHLYESGLILVLLIEQFLPLPLNKQL